MGVLVNVLGSGVIYILAEANVDVLWICRRAREVLPRYSRMGKVRGGGPPFIRHQRQQYSFLGLYIIQNSRVSVDSYYRCQMNLLLLDQ